MENQYKLSYWEQKTFFSGIDVLILGSGIVGLNAAISVKERWPNAKVVILERGPLPIGASTRNAGFACFGSITELIADLKSQTENEVWNLVEKRWRGLSRLKSLIGEDRMGYQQNGGYELFMDGEEATFDQCADVMDTFNQSLESITGMKAVFSVENLRIKDFGFKKVNKLILNKLEGEIDTGKMIHALVDLARQKKIDIFNGIEVTGIENDPSEVVVHTNNGWTIQAQKLIVATNGFARQLLPNLKVIPARNQVMVSRPVKNLRFKGCFHYQEGYYYFRNIDNRILLGGGRNLDFSAEETDQFGTTAAIKEHLLNMLHTVILPDQSTVAEYWWSGILGVGQQKKPIVQAVGPNIIVAVRLGGMGVAIGSLIGEEAAQMID